MSRLRFFVIACSLLLMHAPVAFGDDLPRMGFFGLQVAALTDSAKAAAGYTGEGGVLILKALPGGSAAAKKVNSGIVFSVNGTVVASPLEFVTEVRKLRAGQSATLGLWRNKKTQMVAVPLVAWGQSDFVSYPDEHESIAAIVNGKHPGNAVFWTMPGSDHWMNRVESRKESMDRGPLFDKFNAALPDTMLAWMDSVRK